MSAPRRNAPCPCGSGRRYKDCHGNLGSDAPGLDVLTRRALEAHERGRVDEAARLYEEILAHEPGHAVATHYTGMVAWQRGDTASAERLLRASIAADPSVADFHNNLALLLRETNRAAEAVAALARALEIAPGWRDAHNNLGLTLESVGRWADAIAAYRAAVAADAGFAIARQNLARVLLATGDFAAGWEMYRWRLVAQGVASSPPDPRARPLEQVLQARRFVLIAEQGVGDVLFFLRFAPELVRRGAALAFRGDARLHRMLQRTGLFKLGLEADVAAAKDLEPIHVGDLPWLLQANDAARFPPPLALTPRPDLAARLRSALQAQGPPPRVALTWRAGLASTGPARAQLKRIAVSILGKALRGVPATWISVQRHPGRGERDELEQAVSAPVHDFSRANDDLEEMLALVSLVDGYAGVGNVNAHLRMAGAHGMDVLVPHPPEWRWGVDGPGSPWFPHARVHRQGADGDWQAAMRSLRAAITSAAGS